MNIDAVAATSKTRSAARLLQGDVCSRGTFKSIWAARPLEGEGKRVFYCALGEFSFDELLLLSVANGSKVNAAFVRGHCGFHPKRDR